MIPETLAAFVAFLAFVAPGLAFELLRERRRAVLEESAFREASRVALTSVVFSAAAVGLLSLGRLLRPSWFIDPAEWLRRGQDYVEDNFTLVVTNLAAGLALAMTLAVVTDFVLRGSAPGRVVGHSLWYSLFRLRRPKGTTPWLHVKLSDETEVWGYAGDYTPEQALENRELAIEGPELQYRRKGSHDTTLLDKWSFLAVRGSEITWMKVQYTKNDGDERVIVPAVRPRRSRRGD